MLEKINQGLTQERQIRYHDLIEKRLAETLTPDEHQDLMSLNQQVEQMNVERLKYLIRLAQMRQVSLAQLMNQLGIDEPGYVS